MSRTQDSQKHPALAVKAIEKKAGQQLQKLENYEEWYLLNEKEQFFLRHYIQCRDGIAAAQMAGVSLTWLEDQQKSNESFNVFVIEVLEHPRALAEMILQDLLPESAYQLATMVNQQENLSVKLGAIKHLHNLSGMSSEPASGGSTTVNVTLFDMGPEERIIEGEVNGYHP